VTGISEEKMNSGFFSGLLDSMTDLVRVVDKDSVVIYENEEFEKAFGKTLGSKCFGTIEKEDFCRDCSLYKGFESSAPKRHSGDVVISDRTYSVAVSPIIVSGGEQGAVEVFRDITNEYRLKEKIISSNRKMIRDLEVAGTLQLSILRDKLPDVSGYSFSSVFMPCETLGGDMYDCFMISDDKVAMYIADVSGHGVMSAMLTVYLRQEIFSQFKTKKTPTKVLKGLYESFLELNIESSVYITVFMIVLNLSTGEFEYTNAGHSVTPIIYDGRKVVEIATPGLPVCTWVKKPSFESQTGKIERGRRLLMFTDGLDGIHVMNSTMDGLKKTLSEKQVSGEDLLGKIIMEYATCGEDDITLLMAERD